MIEYLIEQLPRLCARLDAKQVGLVIQQEPKKEKVLILRALLKSGKTFEKEFTWIELSQIYDRDAIVESFARNARDYDSDS